MTSYERNKNNVIKINGTISTERKKGKIKIRKENQERNERQSGLKKILISERNSTLSIKTMEVTKEVVGNSWT